MEKLAVLRYSRALFDLAVEKNNVADFKAASAGILAAMEQDKEMVGVINHPAIGLNKKLAALSAAFAGKVPEEFIGLFALLLRRGRKDDIMGVLAHFDVLYNEYSRLATAKIYSQEPLPADKMEQIVRTISAKIGKTVQAENIIEDGLIAGFRVEVDGYVFDASTKHHMNRLKKQLMAGSF